MLLALAAAAIVPGLMLMWFFHAADVHREPPRVLWACFGLGVLTIPAVLLLVWPVAALSGIEELQNPYLKGTLDAFFMAAIPEELLKYAVVLGYAYRHREFDEPMDGVVYGAAASLGFATLENVLYVGSGGMGVAVLRALTAVPGHAACGVIMGYFVGRAKFEPSRRGKLLIAALVWPIVVHGLYDAPLLIFKAFEELEIEATGIHQTFTLLLLLFWLVAFVFEVVWALRLASSLRQAQLSALVQQGQPVYGLVSPHSSPRPAVLHRAAPAPTSSRAKGWLQLAVGIVLGGLGGLLTLGLTLVLASGSVKEGERVAFVVAFAVLGLLPLGLGLLSFWFGIKNLNVRAAPPGAPSVVMQPLR